MLKIIINIKDRDVCVGSAYYDYELENGTLLHKCDWNGESYIFMEDGVERVYTPIYEQDDIYFNIVGFINH